MAHSVHSPWHKLSITYSTWRAFPAAHSADYRPCFMWQFRASGTHMPVTTSTASHPTASHEDEFEAIFGETDEEAKRRKLAISPPKLRTAHRVRGPCDSAQDKGGKAEEPGNATEAEEGEEVDYEVTSVDEPGNASRQAAGALPHLAASVRETPQKSPGKTRLSPAAPQRASLEAVSVQAPTRLGAC